MAENRTIPASMNDGRNMRTVALGASHGSSKLFFLRVLYFILISTFCLQLISTFAFVIAKLWQLVTDS